MGMLLLLLQISSAGGSLMSQALILNWRCSCAAFATLVVTVAVLLVLQQRDWCLGIFSSVLAPSLFLLLLLLLIFLTFFDCVSQAASSDCRAHRSSVIVERRRSVA